MTKSITGISSMPVWRVFASVICSDKDRVEYVNGNQIPCTKISEGYLYIHGFTKEEARCRAEHVLRDVYDEEILRINFLNTYEINNNIACRRNDGFSGLDLISE